MRPSSSVSLPRAVKQDPSRKQEKGGYLSRSPRRIYYPPGNVDTQSTTSTLPITSPVSTASVTSAKRPLTAKSFPTNASTGSFDAQKANLELSTGKLREFELLLERKHDALVGRVEQHLVNALCAGSTAGNDNSQHMPNVVTEEMLTKIEQNQYAMLEQMAAMRRHSSKNEEAVADLSRTVARLQKKVVTELLQFAAVMTPNDAPVAAAGSASTKQQLEELMPLVSEAVESSVKTQIDDAIDRKLTAHLAPVKDLAAKIDKLLERQSAIEENQKAWNERASQKMIYLESMIRTLGTIAGEFIQMGVEDIASTHTRSVDAIRADIAKAQTNQK